MTSTVTFNGPGKNGERSITTVSMSDEAMLLAVEAICKSEGHPLDDNPGLFVITRTVDGWIHATRLFNENRGVAAAKEEVSKMLAEPLSTVEIEIDGVVLWRAGQRVEPKEEVVINAEDVGSLEAVVDVAAPVEPVPSVEPIPAVEPAPSVDPIPSVEPVSPADPAPTV